MSADGKEAAALLVRARVQDLIAFLQDPPGAYSTGYQTQVQNKWDNIIEAIQYWQSGSVP